VSKGNISIKLKSVNGLKILKNKIQVKSPTLQAIMNKKEESNSFAQENSNNLEKEFIISNFTTDGGKPLPPPYPSDPSPRIPSHPSSEFAPQDVVSIPQASSPSLTSGMYTHADPLCNIDQSANKAPICPRIMVQPETPCPPLVNETYPPGMSTLNSHIPVSLWF